MRTNCRSNTRGEGLVLVIIVLAIIGAGVWWLFNTKKTADQDARAFGRQAVQKLMVEHDFDFLANNLGPQARLDMPRSQQVVWINKFTQMGVPQQPIKIEENVTFESYFFTPRGYFTAHLFYPAAAATLQIAISHPVGKWQLDDMTFSTGQTR
jgi:hypothetical protein